MRLTREEMVAAVRMYYDGCNEGNAELIMERLAPDAVHYFPAGAPQGTFVGSRAIANGWRAAVSRLDSRWTIDHLLVDETAQEVTIEWTHWKPKQGIHLRGVELCRFDDAGRISEIRAYYAAPASEPPGINELGDFDYVERRYPTAPPDVTRNFSD